MRHPVIIDYMITESCSNTNVDCKKKPSHVSPSHWPVVTTPAQGWSQPSVILYYTILYFNFFNYTLYYILYYIFQYCIQLDLMTRVPIVRLLLLLGQLLASVLSTQLGVVQMSTQRWRYYSSVVIIVSRFRSIGK